MEARSATIRRVGSSVLSPNDVPLALLAGAIASALVGALFAGADTALTSLTPTRLAALIEQAEGPEKAALERIRSADAKLRSRYLLGRVLSTTLSAIFTVLFFAPLYPQAAPWLAFGVTVVFTSTLFEVSTTLGRKHADHVAPMAARWLRPLEIVMLPLAVPLGWLGESIAAKESSEPPDPHITEAEVEMLVEEGARSGLFGREPAEMIRNVLEFQDRTAKDVMIPRSRVEAIDVNTPLDKTLALVTESGHSRYPVYREQLDNVVGLLYAKDLFKAFEEDRLKNKSLQEIVRSPANFVAESQPLSTLLKEMRGRRQHLAIVMDEFGGVSGIVTLEDVLEEIVGDIRDEHDAEEAPPIQDLGDGRLMADAAVSIRDLSEFLGSDLVTDGEGAVEQEHTLEGLLTEHLGKTPENGASVSKYGLRFIVRDCDEQHIGKVEIVKPRSVEV
ncbi:hemolysin family protein [Polyangium sp. y55x31]|uniref:hemolysin family protein n=1 Tax=Polyangium sp. y55x31 TaxID=3042688 RepID=UPI002482BB46|nr:hemolysin family protein [Polyangium sp. y55x31]MDI1481140.1 hemolysin family protein [Polyangium sp. y55x31]